MASNSLNADGEFRYIVQWFNEWSELQREDFIPILVDYLNKNGPEVYMNGVVSGMANSECGDKPMTLFQCRIKLFKEWSPKWPEEMRNKLTEKINELDPKIGEKLSAELASIGTETNGVAVPDEDDRVEPNEELLPQGDLPVPAAAPQVVA